MNEWADLWEQKRKEGMSPDQATAFVESERRKRAAIAPDPEPTKPGLVSKIPGATSALQGAALGFSDEIMAGLRSAPALVPGGRSFGDAYGENVEAERAALEAERERHPFLSTAAEVGGAVGSSMLGLGALRAIAPGLRLAQGARGAIAAGAAGGAVAGAGASEGGFPQRALGAAGGAALGAATGGLASKLPAAGSRTLDALGLRPRNAASAAAAIPVATARDRAGQKVLQGLERSGTSLDDVVLGLRSSDKPLTLLDVGGKGVQRVGRGAAGTRSGAEDTFTDALVSRSENQFDRLSGDLTRATGFSPENVLQTADELIEARRANAKPLYDALEGIAVKDDRVLRVFEDVPEFQKAYQRAQEIARIEGSALPDLFDANGKMVNRSIPVSALDYVKRGMDDVIDSGMRGGGIGKPKAMALKKRLRDMLGAVDELVPEYKHARSVYAGDSDLIEALDAGRSEFLKADPRAIRRTVEGMTDGERELYARGALDALRQRMGTAADGRDLSRALAGNREMRDRIQAVFPGQSYDQIVDAIAAERGMVSSTRTVLQGSRTAPMLEDIGDFTNSPVSSAVQAANSPVSALMRAADRALVGRLQGLSGATAEEAADILTAGARGDRQRALDVIEELRRLQQKRLAGTGGRFALQSGLGAEINLRTR